MPVKLNYIYYPFVASSQEYPKLFVERPSVVVSGNNDLREKLVSTLKNIIEAGEVPIGIYKEPEESILIYYALLDVVRSLGDRKLMAKVALAYSKAASKGLESEKDEALVAIANRLGLHARLRRVDPPCIPVISKWGKKPRVEFAPQTFALPIGEYLEIVSHRLIHDPMYTLSNNIVYGGLVYIDRYTFKRILEELVFQSIMQLFDQFTPPRDSDYDKLVEEVKFAVVSVHELTGPNQLTLITEGVARYSTVEGLVKNLFPPCIRRIIDILDNGGNPSHAERFNLVAFLGNIGMDADEILGYFRSAADFNERVARYQVEHILGLRGGRKKYKPYNCDNMKAMNICPISTQCSGGKNPLAVYSYNLKKARKAARRSENGEVEEKAAGGI